MHQDDDELQPSFASLSYFSAVWAPRVWNYSEVCRPRLDFPACSVWGLGFKKGRDGTASFTGLLCAFIEVFVYERV